MGSNRPEDNLTTLRDIELGTYTAQHSEELREAGWRDYIKRKCWNEYGYTPREDQSTALLGGVPACLLQEARNACDPGDSRSLLTRILINHGVEEAKSDA